MKNGENIYGPSVKRYGSEWCIIVVRSSKGAKFNCFIGCKGNSRNRNWRLEGNLQITIWTKDFHPAPDEGTLNLDGSKPDDSGWATWGWKDMFLEADLAGSDTITVKILVDIECSTGIRRSLRNFNDVPEELFDVVLVVKEHRFSVIKAYLATHSDYFRVMFFGGFQEARQKEVVLHGIDPIDIQAYLEVLYGLTAVDDVTVEGLLMLARMLQTELVTNKCVAFLKSRSTKSLKEKFELAALHGLDTYMSNIIDRMTTLKELKEIMPSNQNSLDKEVLSKLLTKCLSFA
ncbi:hypothetical protein CAEBREN_07517 [Caenorhabditis brenneri]|uniref:BTB domain-containing protein n=1 Tax=Caenorhabditis brenneri TaxID=135651 RepID=G0MWB3_CAEBE|nr:hypothetical protein CAEBREN_07517 [Caenorhabditis brenneri]